MSEKKTLRYAGIVLVFFCSLVACVGGNNNEVQSVVDGVVPGLSSSMAELKGELEKHPQNAEARYLLGKLNLQLGAAIAAEKEFRRALEYGWSRQAVLPLLGEALLPQRKFQQVLDEITVENTFPDQVKAQLLGVRGQAELGLNRPQSAEKSLQAGFAADPDSAAVLLGLLGIQQAKGDAGHFATLMARALERHPENRQLLLWQGLKALTQDQFPEAESILRRVIDLEPGDLSTRWARQARLWLVQVYIHMNELGQADNHIRRLLASDPDSALANYLGAIVAFEQGSYNLARNRLLKVMDRHAGLRSARLLQGASFYAQGSYEQAARNISKYLVSSPRDSWAHKLLVKTYLRLGEFEQAGMALQTWSRRVKADKDMTQLLALNRLQSDKPRLAIQLLEEAGSKDTHIRRLLVSAYMMAAETGLALEEGKVLISNASAPEGYPGVLELLRNKDWDAALGLLHQAAKNPADAVWALSLAGGIQAHEGARKEGSNSFRKAMMVYAFGEEDSVELSNPAGLLPDESQSNTLGGYSGPDLQGIYRRVGSWEEITNGIGANSPYTYSLYAENPFSQWMRDDGVFSVSLVSSDDETLPEEEGEYRLIELPVVLLDSRLPPLAVLFALLVIIGLRLIVGMRK